MISLLMVSCGRYGARLEGLDAAIARQNEYRDSVEQCIAVLGQVFVAAPTDSLRWETARKIYLCSNHYSRDTAFRYQRLMEELASDSRQELFSRMAKVRILLDKNENALAERMFLDTDTSAMKGGPLLLDWLSCRIVLYTELASDAGPGTVEADRYEKIVEQTRRRYLGIDSTSFYARRVKAQLLRDNGETDAALKAFGVEGALEHSPASGRMSSGQEGCAHRGRPYGLPRDVPL